MPLDRLHQHRGYSHYQHGGEAGSSRLGSWETDVPLHPHQFHSNNESFSHGPQRNDSRTGLMPYGPHDPSSDLPGRSTNLPSSNYGQEREFYQQSQPFSSHQGHAHYASHNRINDSAPSRQTGIHDPHEPGQGLGAKSHAKSSRQPGNVSNPFTTLRDPHRSYIEKLSGNSALQTSLPPGPPPRPPIQLENKPMMQSEEESNKKNPGPMMSVSKASLKAHKGVATDAPSEKRGRMALEDAFGEEENEETGFENNALRTVQQEAKAPGLEASMRGEPIFATAPDLGVGKDHRKMASIQSNKKFTSNIFRWNSRSEEIRAITEEKDARERHDKSPSSVNSLPLGSRRADDDDDEVTRQSTERDKESSHEAQSMASGKDVSVDYDFLDVDGRLACLLCQRQFKTKEVLFRHAKESDLHKENLSDASMREAGRSRKEGFLDRTTSEEFKKATMHPAGFEPIEQSGGSSYRDRASERRAVFGSDLIAAKGASTAPKTFEGPKKSPTPPPPDEPEKSSRLDESNVGGAMLAKMGWTSGSGLGKSSEGRVDPVETKIYKRGAGLGSSEGRSAEDEGRKRPREEYLDEVRERSKARLTEESK